MSCISRLAALASALLLGFFGALFTFEAEYAVSPAFGYAPSETDVISKYAPEVEHELVGDATKLLNSGKDSTKLDVKEIAKNSTVDMTISRISIMYRALSKYQSSRAHDVATSPCTMPVTMMFAVMAY